MPKYPYFESLEKLSASVVEAVRLSSEGSTKKGKEELFAIRHDSDKIVCELENALFSDFLPPLERDNIAACAHSLSRVIDRSVELSLCNGNLTAASMLHEEAKICVALAEQLHRDITLLRSIRKPSEMPALEEFRALLAEGRNAHTAMLAKISSGAFPRHVAECVNLCGKLRAELSRCFDETVEIMLNNI